MNRRSFFTALLAAPVAVKAALTHKPAFGRFGCWFRCGGVAVLPVIMGADRSPREIARDAINHLAKSGLPTNESGIASAIEAVIDNWFPKGSTAILHGSESIVSLADLKRLYERDPDAARRYAEQLDEHAIGRAFVQIKDNVSSKVKVVA